MPQRTATRRNSMTSTIGHRYERIEQTWGELDGQGLRELKIEVILSKTNGATCLAMPREVREEFEGPAQWRRECEHRHEPEACQPQQQYQTELSARPVGERRDRLAWWAH